MNKSKFTERDFDIFDDFKTTTKPEKQKDIKYLPWVEKFRPQELNEIISNTEIDETNLSNESELIDTNNSGDISETEIKYEPMSPISVISETTLFNETSTRFSTPDYTSIRSYTNEIIPLRGSEYSTNELSNYPRIRYVRKVDGKFYIQVLAGAFPYYHSLVHYPAIKELEKCTTTMQTQGLCVGRVVENSLKKICGKSTDWYNHVASTKWMCHIKHTQFGSDPIEYTETETTKQIITGPNQKYIGKPPQGSISEVIGNPNTGTGNGLGISNPVVGSVEEEELRTEAR